MMVLAVYKLKSCKAMLFKCRFSKHQVVLSFIGDKDEREEIKNSVRIVFKSQVL